jgi:hypothetical protein
MFLSAPGDNALGTETPILPALNNLLVKNASYVAALASIKTLLLAEALSDTVVYVSLTRTTLRPPATPATATLTTLKPNPTRAPRP